VKVSVNWLKQYLDFDLPSIDELAVRIGSQLGEVESVTNLGERYQNVYIVKVVVCEPLENSDHLHRCLIDDGGAMQAIERNEDGLVQVLTGAPNVHAGMLAVWLPPGATVPESYEKEPFLLQSRPMRGAMSHGMLASAKELAIGDSHEGLLEINADEWSPHQADIKPGADFAAIYGLNDYIIDIENKMFTHRPDCFGILGVAREVAGIFGQQFKSPDWYATIKDAIAGADLPLEISNDIPAQVPRFMAVAIKDVDVKPSPLWMQIELARVGAKPISNIVDVTNYVMLLTGQPLHAYDYAKVATGKLGARLAQKGETLALLNGKTIELADADMVITDGTKPIGLAGVMGGAETEVSADTKNIILECATFDMYTIRRTSMRHGLFTDAVTRFNKGQSPLQNPYILSLAMQSVYDAGAGGSVASAVADDDHTAGRQSVHVPVALHIDFVNARLGLVLSADDMATLLKNVEFGVEIDGDQLTVTAPFWRTDIELPEDVVEEIGRLYGFDKLPLALPKRDITPVVQEPLLKQKTKIRNALVAAGANELLTYSFVHGNLLDKVTQPRDKAFKVANALSPDLQYYRDSALASLLDKVHANIKAGYDAFALFELGKGHNVDYRDQDGLPLELENLDLIYASKTDQQGAPYYHARRYLDVLAANFGLSLTYKPLAEDPHTPMSDPFDYTRSAQVFVDESPLGMIGEFKPSIIRGLKLPKYVAGFTISQTQLLALAQTISNYQPLSRFPKTQQDICLRVPIAVTFAELDGLVRQTLEANKLDNTVLEVSPLDIYQRPDDPEHKQVTFHVSLASFERTLTDQEVTKLLSAAASAAHQTLQAETV
jgi:phenylalanyl-tRNA synthetase beta chain